MEKYYSHQCAINNSLIGTGSTSHLDFTGTTYQLGKFYKQTLPVSAAT